MKKLTLLVVLLVAVSVVSFAIEVKPAFTLAGSASVAWGVNLDAKTTGFTNAGSATLTVTIIAADGTDTHVGKGAIRGSITLSNIELYFGGTANTALAQAGGAPAAAAVLYVDPLEIGINAAPTMYTDAAGVIEAAAATSTVVDKVLDADASFYGSTYASQQGTYVKYAGTGFWVKASVVSKGTATANTKNDYALGADVSATLGPVTATTGAFFGLTKNWVTTGNAPISGYLTLATTPIPELVISAGFDWQSAATFDMELGGSVLFGFNKGNTAYAKVQFFMDKANKGFDAKATLMVPVDTLIGKANFDVAFYMLDLGQKVKSTDMAVLVNAGYKQLLTDPMYIQPTVKVAFSNKGVFGSVAAANYLQIIPSVVIGLTTAPAVTLTTTWTPVDLLTTSTTAKLGTITETLAITY